MGKIPKRHDVFGSNRLHLDLERTTKRYMPQKDQPIKWTVSNFMIVLKPDICNLILILIFNYSLFV